MQPLQQPSHTPGFVYVMRGTENRTDEIKVGYSALPLTSCSELHNTPTVGPMNVVRAWSVDNMGKAETVIHNVLGPRRRNDNPEHFSILSPSLASVDARNDDVFVDAALCELMDYMEDALYHTGLQFQSVALADH